MQAVRTLPTGYQLRGGIDLAQDRRALLMLNAGGTLLLLVFGWLALQTTAALRPDVTLRITITLGSALDLMLVASIVLALLTGTVVLHEAIHGLCFWLFTRERPRFGFKGAYAYAGAPDWYIPRNHYLIIGSAPLVVITLLGLLLLALLPAPLLPGLLLVVVLNGAGAVGDIAVVGWLLARWPATTLVQDRGDAVAFYVSGARSTGEKGAMYEHV